MSPAEERIVCESIDGISCGLDAPSGSPAPELEAEFPEMLVEWQATERFYLAQKNLAADLYFVDTATPTREAGEAIAVVTGVGGTLLRALMVQAREEGSRRSRSRSRSRFTTARA